MASRALNLPNILTYGRIIAVPLVVLCFFVDGKLQSSDFARWSALAIFVIASVTDYFDGYLARAWQQHSNIGRMLDPIADKLLVSTCLLLLAADTDRTIAGWSLWAAIIILCREILVSGLREYLAELKVSVPVTRLAKWKTTIQMVAIAVLLAGPALRQDHLLRHRDRHRAAVDLGDRDALHRLRLFPRRPQAHHGRIGDGDQAHLFRLGARTHRQAGRGDRAAGRGEDGRTTCSRFLKARGDGYEAALQYPEVIRVAINQEHVDHDTPIAGAREIALFPPMTGG